MSNTVYWSYARVVVYCLKGTRIKEKIWKRASTRRAFKQLTPEGWVLRVRVGYRSLSLGCADITDMHRMSVGLVEEIQTKLALISEQM